MNLTLLIDWISSSISFNTAWTSRASESLIILSSSSISILIVWIPVSNVNKVGKLDKSFSSLKFPASSSTNTWAFISPSTNELKFTSFTLKSLFKVVSTYVPFVSYNLTNTLL